MPVSASIPVSNSVVYEGKPAPPAANPDTGLTFSEFLSDINPLQYLPVVGTIYRAVTGDTIPRPLREAGSVVVGGLMGGPLGLATGLATVAFEHLTGIDFEAIEQRIFGASQPEAAANPKAPAPTQAAQPSAGPWSPAQLAAYGVVTAPDGSLHRGGLSEADVLNTIQLTAITATPH